MCAIAVAALSVTGSILSSLTGWSGLPTAGTRRDVAINDGPGGHTRVIADLLSRQDSRVPPRQNSMDQDAAERMSRNMGGLSATGNAVHVSQVAKHNQDEKVLSAAITMILTLILTLTLGGFVPSLFLTSSSGVPLGWEMRSGTRLQRNEPIPPQTGWVDGLRVAFTGPVRAGARMCVPRPVAALTR
jgi:hypothetical protein